jgi:hypothetical protein
MDPKLLTATMARSQQASCLSSLMCALGSTLCIAHAATKAEAAWGIDEVLEKRTQTKRDHRVEEAVGKASVHIWDELGFWTYAGGPPKIELQGTWEFVSDNVKPLEDFASPSVLGKQNLSKGTILFLGDSTQREVVHAFCKKHAGQNIFYASEEIQSKPWLQRQGDWWCKLPGGMVFVFMMLYGVDGFKRSSFHEFDSWLLEQASYNCEFCFKTDIRIKSVLPKKHYPAFKKGPNQEQPTLIVMNSLAWDLYKVPCSLDVSLFRDIYALYVVRRCSILVAPLSLFVG